MVSSAKEPLKTAINLRRSGCGCVSCLHLPRSHSSLCSRRCVQLPPYLALNALITGTYLAVFKDFLLYPPAARTLPGRLLLVARISSSAIRGRPGYLRTALQQHRLNMADGARRVQPLRTYTDAVHDAVTAEYTECIAQTVEAAVSLGITAIDQETICR